MKKEVLIKESQLNILHDAICFISNPNQDPQVIQKKINYISKIIDSIIEPERAYKIDQEKLVTIKESLKTYTAPSVNKALDKVSEIKIDISMKQVNKIVYDKMKFSEGAEKEMYKQAYVELKKGQKGR